MNAHAVPAAPKPLGPYSQAMSAGGFVYVSGQLGLDPATLKLVDEASVGQQTRQALANVGAILAGAQSSMANCLKLTCMLAEGVDVSEFNAAYEEVLTRERTAKQDGKVVVLPFPARSTMIVKGLAMGAKVMIDAVAVQRVA